MIKKTYSKNGTTCTVTFRLPGDEIESSAAGLGDFNEWSREADLLQERKNGTWSTTLYLETGKTYRFRYLIDDKRWLNDDEADELKPNRFGSLDGIVEIDVEENGAEA
jgi:1,4-alpha-glucan branching enzyme